MNPKLTKPKNTLKNERHEVEHPLRSEDCQSHQKMGTEAKSWHELLDRMSSRPNLPNTNKLHQHWSCTTSGAAEVGAEATSQPTPTKLLTHKMETYPLLMCSTLTHANGKIIAPQITLFSTWLERNFRTSPLLSKLNVCFDFDLFKFSSCSTCTFWSD